MALPPSAPVSGRRLCLAGPLVTGCLASFLLIAPAAAASTYPSDRPGASASPWLAQSTDPAAQEEPLPEQVQAWMEQAEALRARGSYRDAAALWGKIVAWSESALGADHLDTGHAINNQARLLESQGELNQAETLHRRALSIYERRLPPQDPTLAISLNNLGLVCLRQGRFDEARSLLSRALAVATASRESSASLQATSLLNLAYLNQKQALYGEAETLLKRSIAISETIEDTRDPNLSGALNNLAVMYVDQARFSDAEPLVRRSLAISEATLGPDHPTTASNLGNLAALLENLGRYGEAEPLYRRSLKIRSQVLGEGHPETATSLNNLANLMDKLGRATEAEALFQQSLAIREKVLGSDHPDTGTALNNLATFYTTHHRPAEAEALLRRAITIAERSFGPRHPSRAKSLNNLAALLDGQGRYAEAARLYLEALEINRSALGPQHPLVATSLDNLATLTWNLGDLDKAASLATAALAIREQALGPDHPDTALSLDKLASLQLLLKRYDTSRELLSRLSHSQADWLRRELPLQPRQQRMAQLRAQPDALATIFALLDEDPDTAPLALETRLNRQGLLAEIEQRQRLLSSSSSQNRALAERIAGLDRQLAAVTLSTGQRQHLGEERQRLEAELNRLLPTLKIEPVSTDQVASALKAVAPQGVLVEFQRYIPYRSEPGDASPDDRGRYVALLLNPDGAISRVPLGPAKTIDQAIGRALSASATNQPEASRLWAEVSDLVLQPLLPRIQGAHELFLSPDAGLHRLPFNALLASRDGQPPLQLRVLTTGRDLVRLQQPSATGGPAVLIANPSYDARRSGPATPSVAPGSERQLRSAELTATTQWAPLPGTAREAQALAPLLAVQRPISGTAATAPLALRQKGPRILHIATHGFFRRDQPVLAPSIARTTASSGQSSSLAGSGPRRLEDPLLRSGLVMAGANHPDADPADDGYLTAAEVTGIDLNGTQLVTLSACESGLGDLQTGEGVYGLQRALTVAGSRSTLLSLWSVDDDATRAFMEAFYTRLLRGESRSDALARTQADFRVHANAAYRSPFVWAAFQLSGDWRPIRSDSAAPPGR